MQLPWRPAFGSASVMLGFPAAVGAPRLLSIRMDSLFVKCVVSALLYFVPPNAVSLSGLFYSDTAIHLTYDPEEAVLKPHYFRAR